MEKGTVISETPTNQLRWKNDILEQLWDCVIYVGVGNHHGSSSVMYDKGTENRKVWKPIPKV